MNLHLIALVSSFTLAACGNDLYCVSNGVSCSTAKSSDIASSTSTGTSTDTTTTTVTGSTDGSGNPVVIQTKSAAPKATASSTPACNISVSNSPGATIDACNNAPSSSTSASSKASTGLLLSKGDPASKVIEIFGEPDDVSVCGLDPTGYWYGSFCIGLSDGIADFQGDVPPSKLNLATW